MDPEEEWCLRVAGEPCGDARHGLIGAAERRDASCPTCKSCFVRLEAAIKRLGRAVARVEVDGTDEGSGAVALRFERIREAGQRGRQRASDLGHARRLRIAS